MKTLRLFLSLLLATQISMALDLPAQENPNGAIVRPCQEQKDCGPGYECQEYKVGLPGISESSEAFLNSQNKGQKICISSGNKTQNSKCATGSNECSTGLMCVAVQPPELVGEQIKAKEEGGCATCLKENSACKPGQMSRNCCVGLTCAFKPQQATGTCVNLTQLNEQQMQEYGFSQKSGAEMDCLYLPGNYYFFGENDAHCCGQPRSIAIGGNTQTPNWLRFCGLVPAGDPKEVTDARFCATSTPQGGSVLWEANFNVGAGNGPVRGRCIASPKVSALGGLELGPSPEYNFNQGLCKAEFTMQDLSDREGLISAWPATNFYPMWEASWPEKNHYRPGDELYLMSFMWLFKNTTVDSLAGLNFKYKEFAGKLYDSFDKYYSKGILDSMEWINQLEKQKECLDPSSPFAFQLRYLINENLIEGLAGTLLSFQCGGADKFSMTTGACTDASNPHFLNDLTVMSALGRAEAANCRKISEEGMLILGSLSFIDPHATMLLSLAALEGTDRRCAVSKQINNWRDGKRHKFYTSAIEAHMKAQADLPDRQNVINSMKRHLDGLNINWLMDPAYNEAWAPDELKNDDIAGLWEQAKANSKSELTKLDASEEMPPIFHWSLILKKDKFAEAFPDTSINGRRFLHIHEKMVHWSAEEKTKYQTSILGSVPTDVKSLTSNNWNGPQALATEASHIMEHLSMAKEHWWRRLRFVREVYTDMVLKERYYRLMQYYDKKLQGLMQENECLEKQILAMAQGMGHDMASFDMHTIYFRKENKCGGGPNSGGNDGSSLALSADAKIGKGSGANGNANLDGVVVNEGQEFSGGGFNFGGTGSTGSKLRNGQGLSKSTIKGPISSLGGDGKALGRAARKGMQELRALLKKERGEFLAAAGSHPAVKMAHAGYPYSTGKRSGSGSYAAPALASVMDMSSAGTSGAAAVLNGDKKLLDKDDKVNFGENSGSVDFSGGVPAPKSSGPSGVTTGLPAEEQRQILSSINAKNVTIQEGDSLWIIINKTYIKSYRKLFESSK